MTKKEIVKQPDFSWQFVIGTNKCSSEKLADKLKPKVSEAFLTCSFLQISPKASSEHLQCTFDNSGAYFCLKVQNEPKTFLKSFFFPGPNFFGPDTKKHEKLFQKNFPECSIGQVKDSFRNFLHKTSQKFERTYVFQKQVSNFSYGQVESSFDKPFPHLALKIRILSARITVSKFVSQNLPLESKNEFVIERLPFLGSKRFIQSPKTVKVAVFLTT